MKLSSEMLQICHIFGIRKQFFFRNLGFLISKIFAKSEAFFRDNFKKQ